VHARTRQNHRDDRRDHDLDIVIVALAMSLTVTDRSGSRPDVTATRRRWRDQTAWFSQ
jgi:hypothetical protein